MRYGITRLIPRRLLPQRQEDPIDNPVIRREIARVQRIVEGQNFEIRLTLQRYAAQIEDQRGILERRRRAWLLGDEAPRLLADRAPQRYDELSRAVGDEVVQRAERDVGLLTLDRLWSEHLARIADLREGIHLVRVGGDDPLTQFRHRAADLFRDLGKEIDAAIVRTLESAEITEDGIDLDKAGLRAPSSTWTYIVSDDPFRDQLGVQLVGPGRFGIAAVAALTTGPMLIAWGLYNRYFKKKGSTEP